MGGSHKRIPLRDSTNDLPLDSTSINKAPSPQNCLDTSKQDTDEILPIPRTIGLHLNGFVNPSVSSGRKKKKSKMVRLFLLQHFIIILKMNSQLLSPQKEIWWYSVMSKSWSLLRDQWKENVLTNSWQWKIGWKIFRCS